VQDKANPLYSLLQICREQLRLCEAAPARGPELARLLGRKEEEIHAVDFPRLDPTDVAVCAQAREIADLEQKSLEALKAHRDAAVRELERLSSARCVREAYLKRRSEAKGPRLFDRSG
jgi:hypothetical protein